MPRYAPYTTTVVGAHSVPRWYEALDRLVALDQLAEGDFADAQLRASQAAILEQEVAGIDVITGGEMHRRRHNRHSPPNAMLNHFWHKIPSFQGETRPSPSRATTPMSSIRRRFAEGRYRTMLIWASPTNSKPSRPLHANL
jgi:5-methyltetrahydropteroyltriglutamate--homocysteine methyltransferase